MEEMAICLGDDEDESAEVEKGLMDNDDRQLIDTVLQYTTSACEQSTPSTSTAIHTTPTNRPSTSSDSTFTQTRPQLTEQFSTQFLRDILPLHMIPSEPHSTLPEQVPEMSDSSDQ